ncbi:hypothetical protein XELAEV_18036800mg [Xenopus laevis]|uniref:Uncharacterized protein n=1 Tax=Xenopus laevis TaxID=8355 RepID=A0A974H9T0_XENLA|nr:hypothetical protein XELAEV_18036800mg [Xenopus laevis]
MALSTAHTQSIMIIIRITTTSISLPVPQQLLLLPAVQKPDASGCNHSLPITQADNETSREKRYLFAFPFPMGRLGCFFLGLFTHFTRMMVDKGRLILYIPTSKANACIQRPLNPLKSSPLMPARCLSTALIPAAQSEISRAHCHCSAFLAKQL